MIVNFRPRDLKRLFAKRDRRRVRPDHVDEIERILARLVEAIKIGNMNLPGLRLHLRKGGFAVTVGDGPGNWRICV
jgi:hypothetical protein